VRVALEERREALRLAHVLGQEDVPELGAQVRRLDDHPALGIDRARRRDPDADDGIRELRRGLGPRLRDGITTGPDDRRRTLLDRGLGVDPAAPGAIGLYDGRADARATEVEGENGRT
ncbi:MAG TPA: hypothetical protein VFP19_01105, partial [Candidatus Limnocylindrales bacterium]|nr:hypothetical protein [Candidatus Limnocylindrales bacterium]